MLELLNIRFTFSLRTAHQNSDGKSAIVLRITFQGQRRDIFTGLYCFKKDWDAEAGKVKNSDERSKTLNQNLAMILQSASNSFDEMRFSRQAFTLSELINKIKGIEDQPTLLIDYLTVRNKTMLKRVGAEIIRATYNKYNRGILLCKNFLRQNTRSKISAYKELT